MKDNTAKNIIPDIVIPGADVGEEIGRGAFSVVYKGKKDGQTIAIKVSHENEGNLELLRALHREATILARAAQSFTPELLANGSADGRAYIVMEFLDGSSIRTMLRKQRLTTKEAITVAWQCGHALRLIHSFGLIHRDVKPENIIWDREQGPKLIDFGMAWLDSQKEDSEEFAGSFYYCSPEQLGVLKAPVDLRSDLYSLGVVLYECLSGMLPFQSDSLSEWISVQGSKSATPLGKVSNTDPAFVEIVMKLIAKDPSDRYSSASEFLQDLEQLDAQVVATKQERLRESNICEFALPLIGRDEELSQIEESWKPVEKSQGAMYLIEGKSGSGKSRLIQEFLRKKKLSGAQVLECKCELNAPMPLSVLREAMDNYLRDNILGGEDEIKTRLIEQLTKRLGSFLGSIGSFSEKLRDLFSLYKIKSGTFENENQYITAIAEAFIALGSSDSPVILFVDDVQWLDKSSLKVLNKILEEVTEAPIFLLLSARVEKDEYSIDVEASFPPLSKKLTLSQLGEDASNDLVSHLLGNKPCSVGLLEHMYSRTKGMPFAINEYLTATVDGGALAYNWGEWQIDEGRISQLEIPSDVLELVINRAASLPSITKRVLSVAAVVGSRFDLEFLVHVCGFGRDSVYKAISQALRNNLIEKKSGSDELHFVHDRVQEAFLQEVPASQKRHYHQQVAEKLLELDISDSEATFTLARHFSLGEISKTPDLAYTTILRAGNLAVKQWANSEAYDFLKAAYAIANDYGVEFDQDHYASLSEVCFRTYNFEEALKFVDLGLRDEERPLVKAQLWRIKASIYDASLDIKQAFTAIKKSYSALKLLSPANSIRSWFSAFYGIFYLLIVGVRKKIFGSAKGKKKQILEEQQNIAKMGTFIVYKSIKTLLLLQNTLLHVTRGLYLGHSRELELAFINLSSIARVFHFKKIGDHFAKKAFQYNRHTNDPISLAQLSIYSALAKNINGNYPEAVSELTEAQSLYGRWVAGEDFVNSLGTLVWLYYMRGDASEVVRWAESGKKRVESIGDNAEMMKQFRIWMESFSIPALVRLGEKTKSVECIEYCNSHEIVHPYNIGIHIGNQLGCIFETMDFFSSRATELEKDFFALKLNPFTMPACLKHFYVFASYVRAYKLLNEETTDVELAALKKSLRHLFIVGNRQDIKVHYFVVKGIYHEILGNWKKALHCYDKAEVLACTAESPWAHFEVLYGRARVFRKFGNRYAWSLYSQQAHDLAVTKGWVLWIQRLEKEFSLNTDSRSVGSRGSGTPQARGSITSKMKSSHSVRSESQLKALLRITQVSTSSMDPKELGKNTLDEVISILGAERGMLFVLNEHEQLVPFASRDSKGADIREDFSYSSTIIEKVRATGESLVITGTKDGTEVDSQSIVAHGLRSIIAAPVSAKDKLIGVIYLDSRLSANMFSSEDTEILSCLGSQVAASLEISHAAGLEVEKATLEKDIEIGSMVQSTIIPSQDSLEMNLYQLESFYRPATKCGGDWWNFIKCEEDQVSLVLGDVMGHGIGPAMITAAMNSCFLTMKRQYEAKGLSVEVVMKELSSQLAAQFGSDYSMTGMALELDLIKGTGVIWSAACPHGFLLRKDKTVIGIGGDLSSSLGDPNFTLSHEEFKIEPGDRILLFTDGIFEARNSENQYGAQKLQRTFKATYELPPSEAIKTIIAKVDEFSAGYEQDDDYTALMIQIK